MAVSPSPGRSRLRTPFRRVSDSVSRYDLVLAVLPLGFVLSALAHLLASIPLQVAIGGGALFGVIVTVDALFVHPPSGDPPRSA